jgi:adenosine deaminase
MTSEPLPGVRVPWAVLARDGVTRDDEEFDAALRTAWRLPKVELHLHLEGSLRPQSVCEMAPRYDTASPFCQEGWWETHWTFSDLSGFIDQMGQVVRSCLRAPEDYERAARECFEDLAAQQVIYAELNIAPRIPGRPYYVPFDEAVAAIESARRRVETASGGAFRAALIVGLNRHHALESEPEAESLGVQFIEAALAARERGAAIAGIDLHGDEQTYAAVTPFVPAFRLAEEAGLGRRAHAGEGAGPGPVWESLERLRVQRIAHGVRSGEDAQLVHTLAARGVPLDLCPTSNILTGAAASLSSHPMVELRRAGVLVTVSSDDPLVFETTVTSEIALLHRVLRPSWSDLAEMQLIAAQHSFLPAADRTALAERLREGWSSDAAGMVR